MKIAIGGDHGTLHYKSEIVELLRSLNHDVYDYGTFSSESTDYSDFAYLAAAATAQGLTDRTIVLCNTGIGASISANKVKGIRCALVTSVRQAKLTREHNDTNALSLGVGNLDLETTLEIVKIWLDTDFSNDYRHIRRLRKMDGLGHDYYLLNAEQFVIGGSLKNEERPQSNNMAFYTSDNSDEVIQNRERLYHYLDFSLKDGVFPHQSHSDAIYKVTSVDKGKGSYDEESALQNYDALYTFEPNIILNVFHADCVPVMMYDSVTNVVAIAHSSVIATQKQLVVKLVEQLKQEGVKPENLVAFIGAGISNVDVFGKYERLAEVVKQQLVNSGVHQIHQSSYDSDTAKYHFSASRNDCGRHISFIYRKGN